MADRKFGREPVVARGLRSVTPVSISSTRGTYEATVFDAFKTVEIAMREAAGLKEHEHGRPMVAKAFDKKTGPLAY
jgi:hypothetical protein